MFLPIIGGKTAKRDFDGLEGGKTYDFRTIYDFLWILSKNQPLSPI
jgi:hypothetical protein